MKTEVHQGRSLLKMRLKACVVDRRFEFPLDGGMTEIVGAELLRKGLVVPEQLTLLPAGR